MSSELKAPIIILFTVALAAFVLGLSGCGAPPAQLTAPTTIAATATPPPDRHYDVKYESVGSFKRLRLEFTAPDTSITIIPGLDLACPPGDPNPSCLTENHLLFDAPNMDSGKVTIIDATFDDVVVTLYRDGVPMETATLHFQGDFHVFSNGF